MPLCMLLNTDRTVCLSAAKHTWTPGDGSIASLEVHQPLHSVSLLSSYLEQVATLDFLHQTRSILQIRIGVLNIGTKL